MNMARNLWMRIITILSIILMFTGIVVGALNIEMSRYGYSIILPGTAALSALACVKKDLETFIVFLLLTIITIVGVYRWILT